MDKYFEVKVMSKGKKIPFPVYASDKRQAIAIAKRKNPTGVVLGAVEKSPPVEDRIKKFLEVARSSMHKKVSLDAKITMFRQLSVMLKAGIGLGQALQNLIESSDNKKLAEMLEQIDHDINAGASLTGAMKKHEDSFGSLALSMTELGEKTGRIGESYQKLADILENIRENRTKFKKAIRGPIITLIAMAVAFVILIVVVVPKFKTVFDNFKAELPMPTKILITLSDAFQNYGPHILAGIILIIWLLVYKYKTDYKWRYTMDKAFISPKFYLVNRIIYLSTMQKFTMILSELISAGVSVTEAVEAGIRMVDNEYLKEKLQSIKPNIEKGFSLSDAMKETGLFENMLIQMTRAGEESGTLDSMLAKVTDYYYEKFKELVDNLSSYIEPIMMFFIAGLVLLMALGIFLPMWSLGSVVNG